MAGAQRLLSRLGNFQSYSLFEDTVETEGIKMEGILGCSVSACKKVLCSNSVLDSCDYWLKNDKTLCRVSFLEDQHDGGCTICFVSLDMSASDCHDNVCLKKLASVSPDLPQLLEKSRPLKEHEILLLNGLESPDTYPPNQRAADVCVVQSASGCHPIKSDSLLLQINKFLIGLQSGQEKQRHVRLASQRVCDDDTNRSVSSIEEDFLTASEHLGEESEDDKNDADGGILVDSPMTVNTKQIKMKKNMVDREDSEDSDTLCASCKSQKVFRSSNRRNNVTPKNSRQTNKESNYASSLAETVLQDAFMYLSQDESSYSTEATVSISSTPNKSADEPSRTRTHSFELPKIVIVQSPDNCDEPSEWPGTQSACAPENQDIQETVSQPHLHHSSPVRHIAKPVEIALACAASIIGTISNPKVTKQLVLESGNDEEEKNKEGRETGELDCSLPTAICAMSQLTGAVDSLVVTEDSCEMTATSVGLLSAAQASTAITLKCNVAEGSSMETFRSNVAEILLKEALEVLIQKQSNTSIANFLETTHNKILDGIIHPPRSHQNQKENLVLDDFTKEITESMFKHALEKAVKREDLVGKDSPNIHCFLLESMNSLLFDVLCATSRKIDDISKCTPDLLDRRKCEVSAKGNEAITKPGGETVSQLQKLKQLENTNEVENISLLAGKKEIENLDMQAEKDNESYVNEPSSQTQSRTTGPKGIRESEVRQQIFSSSTGMSKTNHGESKTPVACFAEDLATTVVSMATELAAICLENSNGKQPWFCALKAGSEGSEGLLLPCRTVAPFRRKETQNGMVITKKHRAPRLSEIKRKTEEQPELMERLVNRVVDETVNLDDPAISDPFALFASEVTARIINCPELNVVDTSKPGQPPRSRLQCERWSSRGKASSYESIPEEEADLSGAPNTLDPGNRLGHNLSRGSSISKQSSCESITDEFSHFMVNQMETEGRGFDLLLDYYAGKNANSILAAAVQQVTSKKNGHLNVRTAACLSKQSSTESITEEFYRYMLKDMDKENKDYGLTKTKDWRNSLLPPPSRSPFCIRQSSVPDRRSSDSRLTVNSPIKANSFDGFAQNVYGDSLNIYPSNFVSSTGLCKSDSCLYQRGHTDHITDMLIHETWSSSIESLMRKNKIIAEPSEDSTDQDTSESQPHVQLFANRLATDIVETGKSRFGCQQEVMASHGSVGERRQGFMQPCAGIGQSQSHQVSHTQREVPLIHIEPDQKDEGSADCNSCFVRDSNTNVQPQNSSEKVMSIQNRDNSNRTPIAPSTCVEGACRSLSTSSEESGSGGWAQVVPDEDPHEETTCSFIHLSEGNGYSSASSLGVADLEGFPESSSSTGLNSEERLRVLQSQEQADEATSGLSTAGSSCHREMQVINFDMEVEGVDKEMRATLQWIAASELGIPALYYRKTLQHTHAKFQKVVQLAAQRSWCVGDLFSFVLQFCRLQSEGEEELGLFDWLLKTHR